MATTTAVARPASTTAPFAPDRSIAFTAASCSGLGSPSWATVSELIIAASIQGSGAQFVGLPRRDRRPPVAPSGADIRHDGGNLVVRQGLREGRHAVRLRVARGAGREAAIEDHADRIHGGLH